MNNKYNEVQEPKVFVSSVNQEMSYAVFIDKLFKHDTDDMELMHAALGITGEAGEIADAVKKAVVYCKPIDRDNIVEELGDLRFYMQALMNKLSITEGEVLQSNADKLSKRYPKGEYSNTAAVARLDKVGAEGTLLDNVVDQTLAQGTVELHWGLTKEQQGSN